MKALVFVCPHLHLACYQSLRILKTALSDPSPDLYLLLLLFIAAGYDLVFLIYGFVMTLSCKIAIYIFF